MRRPSAFPGGRVAVAALGLTALPMLSWCPGATAAGTPPTRAPMDRRGVVCTGAIQHPLSVRVEAVGPVRRGAAARLRVTTAARLGIERGEVRLTSLGGAAVAGASRRVLDAVPAGAPAGADFAVLVPRQGTRFLIQFRVVAEGPDGAHARGAAYNLMPDGPTERAREAAGGAGEKLLQVEARRVEP